MSEFEKELEKFNLENGTDYRTLNQYSDVLTTHFKGWQPPKQLVEVPKCVADWFEENNNNNGFDVLFQSYYMDISKPTSWIAKNGRVELLCRMKLEGYTVKKEQLYEIRLPLPKDNDDDYALVDVRGDIWEGAFPTKYKMTESEVKNIDHRYMTFAVKVEE